MTGINGNQVKVVPNSSNVLVLLDSTLSYSKISIKGNDTKIFAFDLPTHRDLENRGISHSLADDYLNHDVSVNRRQKFLYHFL
jgi:hypothetical protein